MTYSHIYFLGIGGIGMSAIARYFIREGRAVGGYDRTPTALTEELIREGALIHFEDDHRLVPADFREPGDTLVIYTPAIPNDSPEGSWFRENGFRVLKRSEMLGEIAKGKYVMAVAGTHGKTTVTTMTAWLNHEASASNPCNPNADAGGGSAFLGGISRNFGSNVLWGEGNRMAVEADEFDRSFLQLWPDAAVITSTDPDHLDIYGSHGALKRSFSEFIDHIKPGGTLIAKYGVDLEINNDKITVYRYSLSGKGDFRTENLSVSRNGYYNFDIVCPDRVIKDCTLGVPGIINVENAVAAVALLWVAGFDEGKLKKALSSFKGVRRRFEIYINDPQGGYIDDYAHHPQELNAALTSIKEMFPGRKVTAIFQPHLYTRTRDFHSGFGAALSLADEVLLVPIYPAREQPIEGVNSELIGRSITKPWSLVDKELLAEELSRMDTDVVVTFGAGDIDRHCDEVLNAIELKLQVR